jgi:uncharacterized OB-fold protein
LICYYHGKKEGAMPFCPKCGYEYEPDVKVCPDCEVELVDQLTEESFDGDIVEVFGTYSSPEGGMVKELLRQEGIFSALSNELGSGVWGGSIGEESEVKVLVSEKDAGKARELIETYLEDNPLEAPEDVLVCENCGARIEPGQEFCPSCGERFEES